MSNISKQLWNATNKSNLFKGLIPALVSSALLIGCSSGTPATTPGIETLGDDLQISLNSGQLSPSFDPTIHSYEFSSMNTISPLQFTIQSARARSATLDGKPVQLNGLTSFKLDRLAADRILELKVTYPEGSTSFQLHTLPQTFPHITIKQTDPSSQNGWTFLSPGDWTGKQASYLMILDAQSRPVYYKESKNSLSDFKQQTLPDGSIHYTYFEQTHANSLPKVGYAEGRIHVMDQSFNEHQVLSLQPYHSPLYNEDFPALDADSHDSLLLGPDDYLLETYVGKEVDNIPSHLETTPGPKIKVVAAILQEVRNGKVVFEWDSTKYPEFYENTGIYSSYDATSPDWYDYMHINSIWVDPQDQNLIVSFRHQNQIVKLDRTSGKILWRLGGKNSDFALTSEQTFSHQHNASLLPNGDLLLFDNGNPSDGSPGAGHSQVMRFRLDQQRHQVTDFQRWQPLAQQYGYAMGSAQLLVNGHLLIGWGANDHNSDVTETDAQGQVLFDLSFDENIFSYRAFKYDHL